VAATVAKTGTSPRDVDAKRRYVSNVEQLLLRFALVFGGLLGFFKLLVWSMDVNATLFFVLLFGLPGWLLLIIFLAAYQRPPDR
jgi:hypothetical protein